MIAKRLQRALDLRKIGVEELARRAGISQGYVSHILGGTRNPTIKNIE